MTTDTMKAENEFYRVLNEIVSENRKQANLEMFPDMIAKSRQEPGPDKTALDVFVNMVQKQKQPAPVARATPDAKPRKTPVLQIVTELLIFAIGIVIGLIFAL